ncbi:MAG TPA: hypothetical protein VG893_03465 [Terracidiphilus sp.]|nr:hypothetical protein [Terracidiphilus sp.]
MKFDVNLGWVLMIVTFACALPAWIQVLIQGKDRQQALIPAALVTLGLLIAILFEYLTTFGSVTLDYSLKFAATGVPPLLFATILARKRQIGSRAPGIKISVVAGLFVWWSLVTMH